MPDQVGTAPNVALERNEKLQLGTKNCTPEKNHLKAKLDTSKVLCCIRQQEVPVSVSTNDATEPAPMPIPGALTVASLQLSTMLPQDEVFGTNACRYLQEQLEPPVYDVLVIIKNDV